jgi:deoxycytidylate deaminase
MKRLVTAVVEKDGIVLGVGTNWHKDCKRIDSATGEDYDKCIGCSPYNHAEVKAIYLAVEQHTPFREKSKLGRGATLHLYGHTYACDSCTKHMKMHGIKLVLEDLMECRSCHKKSEDVAYRSNAFAQEIGNDPDAMHTVCDECDYQNRMDI